MTPPKKKRALWSEDSLAAAVAAVQRGQLSTYQAAARHGIPRRTLRNHLNTGKITKDIGRRSVLNKEQEQDLVRRIIRFSEIGIPLTPKVIRQQAFTFCETYKIPNNFNTQNRTAGKDWLKLFLMRNPILAKRKAQFLNPARAQKLNRPIVAQHFQEVKKIYDELDLHYHPERIYNMDEKGCRLTIHSQPTVIAQKGAKRVHMQASEYAENVTVVGCVNALGNAIPPMILFKGIRKKPEFDDNLPTGSIVRMAPKGSMTTELFLEFVKHLGKYKTVGKCLLIFDGAKSHLDFRIVEEAEKYDIVLYCLPSNTTHELQPLDKACYRPFEHYWDQEVLQFLYENRDKKLTKARFNVILSRVWSKCMTHENITSGFRATGLFPLNEDAIPEIAFAPSVLTARRQDMPPSANSRSPSPIPTSPTGHPRANSRTPSPIPCSSTGQAPGTTRRRNMYYISNSESSDDESQPREIIKRPFLRKPCQIYSSSSDDEDNNIDNKQPDRSPLVNCQSDEDDEVPLANLTEKSPFQKLLPTPDYAVTKNKPRRKALNYKGQRVTKDIFQKTKEAQKEEDNQKKTETQESNTEQGKEKGKGKGKGKGTRKSSKKVQDNQNKYKNEESSIKESQECWYCPACNEDRVADMRPCTECVKYYHEECVGLTKNDKDIFVCPNCCE